MAISSLRQDQPQQDQPAMRLDSIPQVAGAYWPGPRTWLLAVIAGWGVCVWLLGLAGLGGQIRGLPDNTSLLQRLPQPPPAPPERLRPLGSYSEIGARPLFSDDRRPQPFFINPDSEGDQKQTFDFILTSVVRTPRFSMAIMRPSAEGSAPIRVKVGEAPSTAPAWTLVSVDPRSAVFSGPEGERTLELRVFNGVGGEEPTTVNYPAPPGPGVARRGVQAQAGFAAAAPAPGTSESDLAMRERGMSTSNRAIQPNRPPPTPPTNETTADEEVDDSAVRAEQIEAIRRRIEARRAQLQQRQESSPPVSEPVE